MSPLTEHQGDMATRHLAFSGSVLPAAAGFLALLLFGMGFATAHHMISAVGLFCLLLVIIGLEVRGRLTRVRNGDEGLDLGSHVLGSAIVAWTLTGLALGFAYRPLPDAQNTLGASWPLLSVALSGALLWGLKRYFGISRASALTEANGVLPWLRMGLALTLCAGVSVGSIELQIVTNDTVFVRISMLCMAIPTMEWIWRALMRREGFPPLIGNTQTVSFVFGGANPIDLMFDHARQRLGIDLHSLWALDVLRRSLAPVLAGTAVLAWLSSVLVPVDLHSQGLVERFGVPLPDRTLEPGLHLKAPWPIDRVHRVNVTDIHELPIGFVGAQKGASLLWTKLHATEEHSLLVGDGRDLLTVNAVLNYRISDARSWHYMSQNPHDGVRSVAEHVLLRNTVDKSLEDVLSENLSSFAKHIQHAIQDQAEARSLGIEVVHLSLLGLHPPIEVAADYQAVVSAQHDMETQIFQAEKYATVQVSRARRSALDTLGTAEQGRLEVLARARGAADRFLQVSQSHAFAPDLFSFRKRLEVMDARFSDTPITIVDDRIAQQGGGLWLWD